MPQSRSPRASPGLRMANLESPKIGHPMVTRPSQHATLVTGAGGVIGGHLIGALLRDGHQVSAVDHRPTDSWQQLHGEADNMVADLSQPEACRAAVDGTREVFNLASDMGGMGFIEGNKARCMLS